MWLQSYRSKVTYSLLPFSSIAKFDAFPLFCSASHQISMLIHDRTPKPFSSKENAKTDRRARLFHRPSTSLPTYEAPTWLLFIDHTLLLLILFSNVSARAYVSYPSRDDTASPHGSDQSRSSRACQTPLWLHAQILPTYLNRRSGSFGVSAEGYH
jgi:hypothetical protein